MRHVLKIRSLIILRPGEYIIDYDGDKQMWKLHLAQGGALHFEQGIMRGKPIALHGLELGENAKEADRVLSELHPSKLPRASSSRELWRLTPGGNLRPIQPMHKDTRILKAPSKPDQGFFRKGENKMDSPIDTAFRWSPKPQAWYCQPGMPNPWIAWLDTPRWNLAWLALEDPVNKAAPKGFREKLEQSMGCVATTRIMKKRITMLEIATEDSLHEAAIILICDCKWEGEKPALLKMRGWRKLWRDRAEIGCWKHKVENGEDDSEYLATYYGSAENPKPSDPADIPIHDVTQAQNILRQMGLATRFRNI